MTNCGECSGSGHCDACDGYGTQSESYPGAGDEAECEVNRPGVSGDSIL